MSRALFRGGQLFVTHLFEQQRDVERPAEPFETMSGCMNGEIDELVRWSEDSESSKPRYGHRALDQLITNEATSKATVGIEVQLQGHACGVREMQMMMLTTVPTLARSRFPLVADAQQFLECAIELRLSDQEVDIARSA